MSNKKKPEEKTILKVILVGNAGVGKTAIINRFYKNSFTENMLPTIAMNYIEKKIIIEGQKIYLSIWDTVGQEEYKSCNKLFLKNSNIVILVYDITRKISFNDLDYWHETIENELGENPYLALAGNKVDLIEEEEVNKEEGKKLAEKWSAYFSLLSAKSDKEGIDKFFYNIVEQYLKCKKGINFRINSLKSIKIKKSDVNKKKEKGSCCAGGDKSKKEKEIKVLFLGGNKVGKTSIIQKILGKDNDKINYEHTTKLIENKYMYELENKKNISINLLDSNEECIRSIKFMELLKYVKIIFLVFDANRKDSLNILNNWVDKIKDNTDGGKKFIIVLGTNINDKYKINDDDDNNNYVTYEEGEKFAKDIGSDFRMVSIDDTISLRNLIRNNIEKYLNYN